MGLILNDFHKFFMSSVKIPKIILELEASFFATACAPNENKPDRDDIVMIITITFLKR